MIKAKAQCVIVLTCLLWTGCAAKHPVAPQSPAVVANKEPKKLRKSNLYPPQIPKEGDFVIHGCTVTKEAQNKADCICRHAVTRLAVDDPQNTTLQCR